MRRWREGETDTLNSIPDQRVRGASRRKNEPVFLGGGSRPNSRFQLLCELADIKPRMHAKRAAVRIECLARFDPTHLG